MLASALALRVNACFAFGGWPYARSVMRVYVYPSLPAIECTNVRRDKDLFEPILAKLLRESSLRSHDPAEADVFYVPACLTDYYFRVRNLPNGKQLLRDVEDAVLAQIASTGFGHRLHILNGLRCRSLGRFSNSDTRNHIVGAFPRLWAKGRFANFCAEAMHAVDVQRSVHVPYCSAVKQRELLRPRSAMRSTKVLFIGSHLFSRKHVLRALHQQANITRKLVLVNPFRRAAPGMLWCDGVCSGFAALTMAQP